jgi:hypothetical protein
MTFARSGLLIALLALGCSPTAPPPGDQPAPGATGGSGQAGRGGAGGAGGSTSGTAGTGGSAGSGGSSGSGGSAGSGGAGGGAAGTGGASAPDAKGGAGGGSAPDAGRTPDRGPGAPDGVAPTDGGGSAAPVPPGGFGAGPLTECMTPSLGRFQQWLAHANITPTTGLLVKEGDHFVLKAHFSGADWGELVVPLSNNGEAATTDLSKSAGFTISYVAAADVGVQIRGNVQPHGGDQHVALLPATGGQTKTLSFRFVPEDWTFLAGLGKPRVALADVIKAATIFDIVSRTANDLTISYLRFDNYAPPCR